MNRIALTAVAAFSVALVGFGGPAMAQMQQQPKDTQPSASPAGAPPKIEGTVMAIDQQSGTVTLRGSDGQTHSFKGDSETLKDLKVGDTLELNKRK
jgi:Cu/Ag efflux protein CusF